MRTRHTPSIRLLALGAVPRLVVAALILVVLWGALFWAMSVWGGP